MLNIELLIIVKTFRKWQHYLVYILYSTKVFTNHLNYHYLVTKMKLNGREARWIKELTTFDFTIIYYKKAKNLIDSLFRRLNFKDDNELFIMKRQLFSNFLFKFQEHLEDAKSNPVKEQSIDSNETSLSGNVLSLAKTP